MIQKNSSQYPDNMAIQQAIEIRIQNFQRLIISSDVNYYQKDNSFAQIRERFSCFNIKLTQNQQMYLRLLFKQKHQLSKTDQISICKMLKVYQYFKDNNTLLGGGCGQSAPIFSPKEEKIIQQNMKNKQNQQRRNNSQEHDQEKENIKERINELVEAVVGEQKGQQLQYIFELQSFFNQLNQIKNFFIVLISIEYQLLELIQKYISLHLAYYQDITSEITTKNINSPILFSKKKLLQIVKEMINKVKNLCQTQPLLHILYYFHQLKKIICLEKNNVDCLILQNSSKILSDGLYGIVFIDDAELFLKVIGQAQFDLFTKNQKNFLISMFEYKEEILLNLIKLKNIGQEQPSHMILDVQIYCHHKLFQNKKIQESSPELICYALQQVFTLVELMKDIVFDNGLKYTISQSKYLIPFLEDEQNGILQFTKTSSFAEKIGIDFSSYLSNYQMIRYFSIKIILILVELFEEQKQTALEIYEKLCDQLYILLFLEKSPYVNTLLHTNQSAKMIFQARSEENQKNLSNEITQLNQRQQQIKLIASQDLQKSQKRKLSSNQKEQFCHIDSLKDLKQDNFSLFFQGKIIENWKENLRLKKEKGIIEKDDSLLETVEYYIEQPFKFYHIDEVEGFEIVKKVDNNFEDACQFLMNSLIGIQGQGSQSEQKIFVVVGGEGCGKSILLKKMELSFVQSYQSGQNNNQNNLVIPILISIRELQRSKLSLEKAIEQSTYFITSTNLTIDSLKKSNHLKAIFIDGLDDTYSVYENIWKDLHLQTWNNVKLVITCRESDFDKIYSKINLFSVIKSQDYKNLGQDQLRQQSYLMIKLEYFQEKEIEKYFQKYFYLNHDKKKSYKLVQLAQGLLKKQSEQLLQLLKVPINLYCYTSMISQAENQEELQNKILSSVENSFWLQEKFIYQLLERQYYNSHAQKLSQLSIKTEKQIEEFKELIIDQYLNFFENIALHLLQKRRSLQEDQEEEEIISDINLEEVPITILSKLKDFLINQKKNLSSANDVNILGRQQINQSDEENEIYDHIKRYYEASSFMEIKKQSYKKLWCSDYEETTTVNFKHSSLMEYFVARAMIRDFKNLTSNQIKTLSLSDLFNFAINSEYIITPKAQYEQNQIGFGILNKLCFLMKDEINKEEQEHKNNQETEFDKPKSNKFIEYVKRTRDRDVIKMKLKHQLDIGSSNILSALCQLKYNLSGIDFSFCSFSNSYLFDYKGRSLNLTGSNLSCANLSKTQLNTSLARTEKCIVWKEQAIFDTHNLFSFSIVKHFPDDHNTIFCGSSNGYLNIYSLNPNINSLQRNGSRSRDNSLEQKYQSQNSITASPLLDRISTSVSRQRSRSPTQTNNKLQKQTSKNSFRPGTSNSFNQSRTSSPSQQRLSQIQLDKTIRSSQRKLSQVSIGEFNSSIIQDNQGQNLRQFQLIKSKKYFKGAIVDAEDYFNTIIIGQNSNILCIHRNTLDLLSMLAAHEVGEIRLSLCVKKHLIVSISLSESICKVWLIKKQSGFHLNQKIENHLESHKHVMSAVKISQDGNVLAIASTDKIIRIYNANNSNQFELANTLRISSQSPIGYLSFSVDGAFLAAGGVREEKYINLFDFTQGNLVISNKLQMAKDSRFISNIQFTPNKKYLIASYKYTGKIQMWLVNNSQLTPVDCIQAFADNNSVDSISFFYTKNLSSYQQTLDEASTLYMCAGSSDGQMLKTWIVDDSKLHQRNSQIIQHSQKIECIRFCGDSIVSVSKDQKCILWKYQTNQFDQSLDQFSQLPYKQVEDLSNEDIKCIEFSPNNRLFAAAIAKKGKINSMCKLWLVGGETNIQDFNKDNLFTSIQGQDIYCLCFSRDSQLLAYGDVVTNSIIVRRLDTLEKVSEIKLETNQCQNASINFMQYSIDNKYLYAIVSGDSSLCYLWDVAQQYHEMAVIKIGKSNKIIGAQITSDNSLMRIITSKGEMRTISIQNSLEMLQKQQFNSQDELNNDDTSEYISCGFSHNSKYIAIGRKKQIEIWNVDQNSLQLIHRIKNNIYNPLIIRYVLNSNTQLSVVDYDKRIRIYDLSQVILKQNVKVQYIGHTSPIISAEFSLGSSSYLLTTSSDNVSKLWNVQKGFELIQTFNHCKQIQMNPREDTLVIVPADPNKKEIIFTEVSQNFSIIHNLQYDKKISQVCYSPNLQLIALSQKDCIKLCNFSKQEIVVLQELNCIDLCEIMKFSSDSSHFASSFGNGQLSIWKRDRNQYSHLTNLTSSSANVNFATVIAFCFSNNKKYLSVGFSNQQICVWNIHKQNLNIVFQETLSYGSAINLLFSNNNSQLMCQGEDFSMKTWNINNDKFLEWENSQFNRYYPYNISPKSFNTSIDGKLLVAGYQNSNLEIWRIEKDVTNSLKQKNSQLLYIL